MPIHGAPSPPIWVMKWNARPGPSPMAMVWQPMPPPATWPSSSMVDRLCGQPEQKFGDLTAVGKCAGLMRASRAPASMRSPNTRASATAIISGFSSPFAGNSMVPSASALPSTAGLLVTPYRISLSCVSTKLRFSSTTSKVCKPLAKSRVNSGSSGNGIATLPRRMPSLSKSSPRSRTACSTSTQALPVAAIPSHAPSRAPCHLLILFNRANCRAASRRLPLASCSIFNVNGLMKRTSKWRW